MPPTDELGPLELDVMQAVWRGGGCTVRDVLEVLNQNGRGLAYTTVQTVMNRLEEKGYLSRKAEGNTFRYRARITERVVQRRLLGNLLDRVFQGAPSLMVSRLADTRKLTPEDIAALREIVDKADADSGPRDRRRTKK